MLVLGRVPIERLGAFGVRFNLFYETPGNAAVGILAPFFRRIRRVRVLDRPPTRTEKFVFQKMMSVSQRVARIWPVPFDGMGDDKWARNNPPTGSWTGPRVLLQTHLDGHHGWKGATAKIWQVENWISVIRSLHEADYGVAVMEWDAEALMQIKSKCPYVIDASKGDLCELSAQIGQYDCVVSVDSWVKYAAAWQRRRQVILVPDLRNGYTPDFAKINADWIAAWWFHGLMNDPNVKVIGLEKKGDKFEFTLAKLADLAPQELVQEIINSIES